MDKYSRLAVVCLAVLVALLVLTAAYATDRFGWVDELGFLNPPYMFAHFGKLTFPAWASNAFFDLPIITHPPLHTFWIGLLVRLGMTFYYAEATPTVFWFLLTLVVIVRSAFPDVVKLGLLFSVGYLMAAGESLVLCFGTRPEGELFALWFCGLILLESGRLANWNCRSLAAGALLLTWASGVHYYAAAAFTGVLVYGVWAVRSLGWNQAKPRLLAMGIGGCLFGIPYLTLYLLPYSHAILATVRDLQQSGGISDSIRRHQEMYSSWATSDSRPALLRLAMAWHIPLMVFSTAILSAIRTTRGLALAALPVQLFLFFFARHKLDPYLIHETTLFVGAVAIGLLVLLDYLAGRLSAAARTAFRPVAAALLTISLVVASPVVQKAHFTTQPRIHETELARAATREILGHNARVSGSWGEWYSSGAAHWYNNQVDIQFGQLLFDPATYFSNFDAVVDCPDFCVGGNAHAPSRWFADGSVKLRGFFFGETNDQLQFVLLSAEAPAQLAGYAVDHDRLYRFQQESAGAYEVTSAVCPVGGEMGQWGWNRNWPGIYSTTLQLPLDSPDTGRVLVTMCAPKSARQPAAWMATACRPISRTQGTLSPVDGRALVARMRREDPPMHFYRSLDQIPGYKSVGLPPQAIAPLGLVPVASLDISHLTASSGAHFDSRAPKQLITYPGMGGFSMVIPVAHTEIPPGPCWLEMRMKVISGKVGFLAMNTPQGRVIAGSRGVAPAPEPQTIAIKIPDFKSVTDLIVTNESSDSGRVEILDATIFRQPETSHLVAK